MKIRSFNAITKRITYRNMTTEEISDMNEQLEAYESSERKRPYTAEEVTAMLIKEKINEISVDDQTALRMISFYPEWADIANKSHTAEKAGFKFLHEGNLYKTRQENHTFSTEWIPGEGTESIYERIDEVHDGSKYDPIPYDGNMVLTAGLYYTQDGVTYLCKRDTGNPVYNALAELVGLYVEVA